jgi:hypothetical protein
MCCTSSSPGTGSSHCGTAQVRRFSPVFVWGILSRLGSSIAVVLEGSIEDVQATISRLGRVSTSAVGLTTTTGLRFATSPCSDGQSSSQNMSPCLIGRPVTLPHYADFRLLVAPKVGLPVNASELRFASSSKSS